MSSELIHKRLIDDLKGIAIVTEIIDWQHVLRKAITTLEHQQAEIQDLQSEAEGLRKELLDEEGSHSHTIGQRDRAEHFADQLSSEIGAYFGIDVGEHSNLNCPWENALEIIPSPPLTNKDKNNDE